MSTTNPLQPQGTLEGVNPPKSRLRITILTILGLHVVFIGGLLLQGCDKGGRTTADTAAPTNTLSSLPSLNDPGTNYYTSFPETTGAGTGTTATPGTAAGTPGLATTGTGLGSAGTPAGYGSVPTNNPYTGSASAFPPPTDLGQTPSIGTVATPGAGTGYGAGTAPVTGATTEHTIKSGDLIRDLAKKYGVTEQAIFAANPNVKPRQLKVGDKIVIPAPTAGSSSTSTAASTGGGQTMAAATDGEVYVVKAGDNLTKIAKKFGVTVKQLRSANNLKSDRLTVNQRLSIPAKPAAAPAATAGGTAVNPSI